MDWCFIDFPPCVRSVVLSSGLDRVKFCQQVNKLYIGVLSHACLSFSRQTFDIVLWAEIV